MDDHSYKTEFYDPHTGAHATITQHALLVFTGPHVPAEYGTLVEYPLKEIGWVRAMSLPGGQTAIALGLRTEPKSPGLTFEDARIAHDFHNTLLSAIQRAG